jgi:aspartyl-tRNA(Asn)/glutamyl-tRNA(Gln) amidotransferase subunit C
MSTTAINIKHLKMLARLDLTPEEEEKFARQLGDVLEYFKELDKVDVANIEPTSHAFPLENVWQEDEAKPGFTVEEALRNAPKKRANEFVVPRVVEE